MYKANLKAALGESCNKETCCKNHSGSAKSMEPAAALLMLKSEPLKEADVKVEVLVGDADSSTAAAVRAEFGDSVERALDIQHAKKNFKNNLYLLQKVHKNMTKPVIMYLTATVGTVISKHKGHPMELKSALYNIPEHVFNKHEKCSPDWCRYHTDPHNYKSKYLAKSLGEHGGSLYNDICTCIEKLARKSDELSVGGSTPPCESFNNTVSSKAPKNKHYGGSQSLKFRVKAAVLHKNEGVDYTLQVLKEMELSPGKMNQKLKGQLKRKRLRDSRRKTEPQYKARRKINFAKRGQITSRNENKEGETYRSGLAFDENESVTKVLKVWKPFPLTEVLPICNLQSEYIFFDLETSGLSTEYSEILQISAISKKGSFNTYCQPMKSIGKSASATNMLTVYRGQLQYKGKSVPTLPIKESLISFLEYIAMHGPCILIAHNATFDMRFLVHSLIQQKMLKKSMDCIVGFIDTLKGFRKKFVESKKTGALRDFKLGTLCKFLLGDDYNFEAHNAQADVEALKQLFEAALFTKHELSNAGRKMDSYINWIRCCKNGVALDSLATKCSITTRDLRALVRNKWSIKKLERCALKNNVKLFRKKVMQSIKCKETSLKLYNVLNGKDGIQEHHTGVQMLSLRAETRPISDVIARVPADTGVGPGNNMTASGGLRQELFLRAETRPISDVIPRAVGTNTSGHCQSKRPHSNLTIHQSNNIKENKENDPIIQVPKKQKKHHYNPSIVRLPMAEVQRNNRPVRRIKKPNNLKDYV
ncbi:hypothetical protein B566_EDAN000868 [Ephemera danica]|nr:hypothetical protein B566_EDAN000868 [Ephemera danica]